MGSEAQRPNRRKMKRIQDNGEEKSQENSFSVSPNQRGEDVLVVTENLT